MFYPGYGIIISHCIFSWSAIGLHFTGKHPEWCLSLEGRIFKTTEVALVTSKSLVWLWDMREHVEKDEPRWVTHPPEGDEFSILVTKWSMEAIIWAGTRMQVFFSPVMEKKTHQNSIHWRKSPTRKGRGRSQVIVLLPYNKKQIWIWTEETGNWIHLYQKPAIHLQFRERMFNTSVWIPLGDPNICSSPKSDYDYDKLSHSCFPSKRAAFPSTKVANITPIISL